MTPRRFPWQFGAALALVVAAATTAPAASNITNSLKGFTGDSTQAATQNALAAVGLEFTSTGGFETLPTEPPFDVDPTVNFDAAGAHFGDALLNDGSRNFIRTIASDYANHSFTAEVTWTTTDMPSQAGYFGMGPAVFGDFRIADRATKVSNTHLFMEVDPAAVAGPAVSLVKNTNGTYTENPQTIVPGLDTGTHRIRLTYDWFAKTMTAAFDVNYVSGPFNAEVTSAPINTLSLYSFNGWPTEGSKIYFGGDDGSVFTDLQVTLTAPTTPTVFGDFNNSGTVTAADWVVMRTNQLSDLSAMTLPQSYAKGDINGDKRNDHADFVMFKALFDGLNGPGAFAAIMNAPEPSSLVVLLAGLAALPAMRRARRGGSI
jgi:hypothetical protein